MNMLAKAADIARSPGDPKVQSTGPSSLGAADRMARGLGWFSIGLGAAELLAANRVARGLGLEGYEWLIRGYGLREVASGVACLSANPLPGVTSRVAGDGLDILTLLPALRHDNPKRGNAELALLAVAGVTLLDVLCQQGLTRRHARPSGPRRDYRDRSGFPKGLAAARGAVRQAGEARPALPGIA
ncbi:hypothetical protein QMO56_18630 [Roseomonas sp. E05]|uniref:hypothetical protein n=1 Tax=Roseomonas sp. E05 TaxID=3046310 RepID=UPI0024BB40C8|nr:hypothetical protein [Roseomonas sp. E05]MDJ0390130.1 hypothetical protein [Roseomonas sp. E05]